MSHFITYSNSLPAVTKTFSERCRCNTLNINALLKSFYGTRRYFVLCCVSRLSSAARHHMWLPCLYWPLASPPSTSPLSFSHKSPPHRCSNEIIPLFHLPLHPSPPRRCSGLTPRRQNVCNGHFPLASLLLLRGAATQYVSAHAHGEQVTDHFRHLECAEAITPPPAHPRQRSPPVSERALCSDHSASRWGSPRPLRVGPPAASSGASAAVAASPLSS